MLFTEKTASLHSRVKGFGAGDRPVESLKQSAELGVGFAHQLKASH
jgi:hypothetical protein